MKYLPEKYIGQISISQTHRITTAEIGELTRAQVIAIEDFHVVLRTGRRIFKIKVIYLDHKYLQSRTRLIYIARGKLLQFLKFLIHSLVGFNWYYDLSYLDRNILGSKPHLPPLADVSFVTRS